MPIYTEVDACRMCGNPKLEPIFSLGSQALSGIFPKPAAAVLPETPLDLVKCSARPDTDSCGLLQLAHSADVEQMYGTTYGYYSSLSQSMVGHLTELLGKLGNTRPLRGGDVVLDIGCNDGTLLNQIQTPNVKRVGIDPSSTKFLKNFNDDISVIPDFFSKKLIQENVGEIAFNQITAIAMFYDLDDPLAFFKDIESLLAKDGIWAIELAYLPTMLANLVYDQVCHEHVTYPALSQIKWLTDRAGLRILEVDFNNVNGGSFLVIGTHSGNSSLNSKSSVSEILDQETSLHTLPPFLRFAERVKSHREDVIEFFKSRVNDQKSVLGYGASTKGNIVLNYCGITRDQLPAICDSNPEKWGRVTPGTNIPIVSKEEMREKKPDFLFVLIWHFHEEVLRDEYEYVMQGGSIVFDLPQLHVVNKSNYDYYLSNGFSDHRFIL
jgi:NDP-4-keto-2,6-dideoxyhexose 3-C-methyltransferase